MKITIEAETDTEKKDYPEKKIIDNVQTFGLFGLRLAKKIFEQNFSHVHGNDRPFLIGKLEELKERIREMKA